LVSSTKNIWQPCLLTKRIRRKMEEKLEIYATLT
jgi:hypothetical protein